MIYINLMKFFSHSEICVLEVPLTCALGLAKILEPNKCISHYGLSSFRLTGGGGGGGYFDTREKSLEARSEAECFYFLECVRITSVGLKLDRPQLQHWLLFLAHNRSRSENSNVVAGLPVRMGYGCVYDSAFDSSSPFDFE